jgi:hypothetical protein
MPFLRWRISRAKAFQGVDLHLSDAMTDVIGEASMVRSASPSTLAPRSQCVPSLFTKAKVGEAVIGLEMINAPPA